MESTVKKPLFVIEEDPVVEWPVSVKLPASGGSFDEYQFAVSMRVLSPRDYEQLFADAPGSVDAAAVPKLSELVELNAPIFQSLIIGWYGVSDSFGNPVPYSPETLAKQITGPRGPALSAGIWRAISEVRFGARLGN